MLAPISWAHPPRAITVLGSLSPVLLTEALVCAGVWDVTLFCDAGLAGRLPPPLAGGPPRQGIRRIRVLDAQSLGGAARPLMCSSAPKDF